MSILGQIRVPKELIKGAACQWLLKHYMENESFAKEREDIQEQYSKVLEKLLAHARSIYRKLGMTQEAKNEMKNHVQRLPALTEYIDQLLSLCLRWGLDYPWAPLLLVFNDLYEITTKRRPETKLAITSTMFTAITGIPPSIVFEIPSFVFYLGKKKEIHKLIDELLDNLPKDKNWKDIPHGMKLHTKWLYARKARRMTAEEIERDPDLNPVLQNDYKASSQQIRRAIRNLDRLLGGQPRPPGRPKHY